MKLRVGVIGLGDSWESRYRSALAALSDRFQVRAIHSPVQRLAEREAREFGARPSIGFRDVATRRDIDAVLVLTSNWYGPLPIIAACQGGKSIYCSGGLDLTLDEAILIRDHIERSGVSFVAEFPRRLAPATIRLKELIATRLGAPKLLFCNESPSPSRERSGVDSNEPNSEHTRQLVDAVDWCRYVIGTEANAVTAVAASDGPRLLHQTLHVHFNASSEEGAGATAEIRFGMPISNDWPEARAFRPPSQMEVVCERGVAFVDLPTTLIWFDEAGRHMESLDNERPIGEQLLMQFHRGVTSLVQRTSGLDDVYRALRVVLKAEQSIKDRRQKPLAWRR